jgi:hypothetical protein
MLKEQKKVMSKQVEKIIRMLSHQIQITNKEI